MNKPLLSSALVLLASGAAHAQSPVSPQHLATAPEVISIDPDESGGDSPDTNDRQWYLRRTSPARVERFPRLWIPLQLGSGICAAGLETDALLAKVREWVARQPVDSVFGFQPLNREDVVVESSESVCRDLAEAYAKLPGEVFTPESVNAVRVGNEYFVMFDPNVMAGEARSVMIFDSSFVLKESRAMNRVRLRQ